MHLLLLFNLPVPEQGLKPKAKLFLQLHLCIIGEAAKYSRCYLPRSCCNVTDSLKKPVVGRVSEDYPLPKLDAKLFGDALLVLSERASRVGRLGLAEGKSIVAYAHPSRYRIHAHRDT